MPSQVFDWTVREFRQYSAGQAKAHRQEMQVYMWQAWHIAQFMRAKRIPPLERLIRKLEPRRRAPKTPQQLLAIARGITKQMGG